MDSKLLTDIYNRFFIEDGKNIVVVLNRDGLLCRKEFAEAFKAKFGVYVARGNSLDLRIIKEISAVECPEQRFLFVIKEEFELLPDIEEAVDLYQFRSADQLFRLYDWSTIKDESIEVLEKLYVLPRYAKLSASQTSEVISKLKVTVSDVSTGYKILPPIDLQGDEVDFNNPTAWINGAAAKMMAALRDNRWFEVSRQIDAINEKFQQHLVSAYAMMQSSGCSMTAPKIVTHILPFIKRQEGKCALVVVDGMNYWQGQMLMESIKCNLGRSTRCDCIYSWIPSTTELSRQAIFRGTRPLDDYAQNPASEKALWKAYWTSNGYSDFQIYYQHSDRIEQEYAVDRLAYVNTDLDEMMHNSKNYKYLYSLTDIWVKEESTLSQIKHLLDSGYKVFITTDHGNIEGEKYKRLCQREKLGATHSLRHIHIAPEADEMLFANDHREQVIKIANNRTFYPRGRKVFHHEDCVTHGGTHWLEVLVPFITIE